MIAERQLNWINVSELKAWKKAAIAQQYQILFVPTYFVIDRKGKIVYNAADLKDPDNQLIEQKIITAVKEQ